MNLRLKNHLARAAVALLVAASLPALALAHEEAEEREFGWFDTGELAFVQTDGNSEASSLSLRNNLSRVWEDATFTLNLGALRAESTDIRRFAVGTPDAFAIREEKRSDLTAENYFIRGRYDRQITDSLFWYAGAGWEKNEFAGFDSRTVLTAGVGNIWFEEDAARWRTWYGATWTSQDDIVPNPEIDDSFIGLQFGSDYARQLGANSLYESLLVVDLNIDETEDWRADFVNSITTSMTNHLALKVSLQILYDNLPALEAVELIDITGASTGTEVFGSLDEMDTLLTASLVVSF